MNDVGKILYQIGQTGAEIKALQNRQRSAIRRLREYLPDMPAIGREYCGLALTAIDELDHYIPRWSDVWHKFQAEGEAESEIWGEDAA
jgi:hypothetical protein